MADPEGIFDEGFLASLEISVKIHRQLYPMVPHDTLRLIETANVEVTGTRKGRQSLGAKVTANDQVLFSVFFDASDGKCAIRGLRLSDCVMLREWDVKIE